MQMPGFVYRCFFHPHPEKHTLRVGGQSGPHPTELRRVVDGDDDRRKRWLRRMQAYGQRAR